MSRKREVIGAIGIDVTDRSQEEIDDMKRPGSKAYAEALRAQMEEEVLRIRKHRDYIRKILERLTKIKDVG